MSRRPGMLPAFVCGAFDGQMVSAAPQLAAAADGGLAVLRVLLFRKFVGSADTNGRNLLVRSHVS